MSASGLAVAGVRGHTRRLLATGLAIVIGVTFVATAMLLLNTVGRGVETAVADGVDRHDLVLTPDTDNVPAEVVDALRGTEGVASVQATAQSAVQVGDRWNLLTTLPTGNGVELLSGRLPQGPGEVAVTPTNVELTGVAVGDTLRLLLEDDTPVGPVEVVGVVDLGHAPQYTAREALVVAEPVIREWVPDVTFDEVLIDLAADGDPVTVGAVVEEHAPGATLRTGPEEAAARAQAATGDTDVIGGVLMGFGAVALATTAIVIANTFTIVLAQRSRELALLRCVGATRSQVRRSVLTEALILGAVASAVGVLLALGLTWTAGQVFGEVELGMPVPLALQVSPTAVLVPWVVGVVVTALAAWWPSRRATRVAPVAALQPAAPPTARSRTGVLRLVLALLLVGGGAFALWTGATERSVPIGVAGGLLSFGGVLVAAVVIVPAAMRLLGVPARASGVPGRLAVEHATANPSRAAATSAALLVGVTLITMTSVGAASASSTAEEEIDGSYPADVVVTTWPETGQDDEVRAAELEPAVAGALEDLDVVTSSTPLTGSWVDVRIGSSYESREQVLALDPAQAAEVLRSPGAVGDLVPGTVGVSRDMMLGYGLSVGDEVTLSGPDGEVTAQLVEFGLDWSVVAHPDVLAAVDSSAPVTGMVLRLQDDVDVTAAMTRIQEATLDADVSIDGGAPMREVFTSMLNVLVMITTALLGVAVVIAVIGIANTLSLSVLERSREHALLRALGLTRGQLRGTLAVEAVLLAVVSAVLGVLLGIGYGWAGVQSLLPAESTVHLDLPVGSIAAVVGLAVVAGLLASVLPARRAARIAPAAGLALP